MVARWVGKEGRFEEQHLFAFYGQFGKSKIKELLKENNTLSMLSKIPSYVVSSVPNRRGQERPNFIIFYRLVGLIFLKWACNC